jgi:aspartate-semialdehyde dehydrogenase
MAGRKLRGAVIGTTTLLGKELADELNRSKNVVWDLLLLDTDEASGQITAAGDEALVIQPVHANAFAGIDVVFFSGEASTALDFWKPAHDAGASIVDLTGALEGQPKVTVRSPFLEKGNAGPELGTVAVVSAHPVAVLLALTYAALQPLGLIQMAATVLQPASELGSAGVDELHQQTVGLLSFKPLQKDIFDTQVAFNIVSSLGSSATLDMHALTAKIGGQIRAIRGDAASSAINLQLIQAPVFNGFTASVFVEMASGAEEATLRSALRAGQLQLDDDDVPSNERVAGKSAVLVGIAPASSSRGSAFWLWMAADNLRLAARSAAACGAELAALRPMSGVHEAAARVQKHREVNKGSAGMAELADAADSKSSKTASEIQANRSK